MPRRSLHQDCPVVADKASHNWHVGKMLVKAGPAARRHWQQRAQLVSLRAQLPVPVLSPLGLPTDRTKLSRVEIATICRLCKKVEVTNKEALE